MVARDNLGPDVAQVAAVALLVDYIVTVAVQVSAGTNALISLAHLVSGGWTGLDHLQVPVSAAVIVLLAYGNVRGVREAGCSHCPPICSSPPWAWSSSSRRYAQWRATCRTPT